MKRPALAFLFLPAGLLACADATSPSPRAFPSEETPIINGTFDGNGHPNVGALLYDFNADGITGPDAFCTGVLVSTTVFLTAGHCVAGFPADAAFSVTFDADLLDNGAQPSGIIGSVSASLHPGFLLHGLGDGDLGVILLPAGSTAGITPASLPTAGWLGAQNKKTLRATGFENVGYGTSANANGKAAFFWDGKRNISTSPFMGLTSSLLGLLMNVSATGQGGDCYGDSGSPKFVPGTNTIVSITSWGDVPCRATSWSVRLDTPSARNFLDDYLTLP